VRLGGVEECFRHATYRLVLAPADDATPGAQVQTRRTVGDGHQRGGSCVEVHLHEHGPDSWQSWGGAEPQFGGIDLEQLATQPEKHLRPVGRHGEHRQSHGVARRARAHPGDRAGAGPAGRPVRVPRARHGRGEGQGPDADLLPRRQAPRSLAGVAPTCCADLAGRP